MSSRQVFYPNTFPGLKSPRISQWALCTHEGRLSCEQTPKGKKHEKEQKTLKARALFLFVGLTFYIEQGHLKKLPSPEHVVSNLAGTEVSDPQQPEETP